MPSLAVLLACGALAQNDGLSFCDAANNSTGAPAILTGTFATPARWDLHLEVAQGVPTEFAYMLAGPEATSGIMIGNGRLCLVGTATSRVYRYNVAGGEWNSLGRFSNSGVLQNLVGTSTTGYGYDVPLTVPDTVPITIMSGDSWHFQLWYRDTPAGVGTSNFSTGLTVTFGPPQPVAGMIPIAAGMFSMGSNAAAGAPYYGDSTTQPVHDVTITQDFWMGEHEVTQAEYQALMGTNPSSNVSPNFPVEGVSWQDAQDYCAALTAQAAAAQNMPAGYEYRLPTEAEWEFACRAGTTTEFNLGSALHCSDANMAFSAHSVSICNSTSTVAVGTFAPNGWGLYDMHGNVKEWCLDSYGSYYPGAVSDPFASSGPNRVTRGGSWALESEECRSSYRNGESPFLQRADIGFRVVLASPPPPAVNFAPSSGIVPLPSDLLYSGTADLTLSIPGVDDGSNPNATPLEIALSAMDGWSTSAPFTIDFNTPLDALTVTAGTTVRLFEVTLDRGVSPVGGPVNGVVGDLVATTGFSVGMAPDVGTNDKSIRVYLEKPLKANTSYMWVLTNGITALDGTPCEKTGEYLLASSQVPLDPSDPIAPLQELVGAQLAAAVGEGMVRDNIIMTNVFTTQGVNQIVSTFAAITAGQEAAIIAALCGGLPSGCVGENTAIDPNNTSSLLVNMPTTITTADRVFGSPGVADVYTGDLAVPYYLTGAANPSETAAVINTDPLTERFRARFNFLTPPLVDDHHVTSLNVLPATTAQEVIPVLISVPNIGSGQAKPIEGWPVVIFQHGLTRDRTDMLAIADAFAFAGIMVVAIDLPLHGYTTSVDPVIFAGYDSAQPGARERNFGLDLLDPLGASGSDGAVDPSGSHFINLANLLVTRDNLRQSSSDLLHLTSQLATLDYDGGGADVDATRFHFVGHSFGGIVGIPFLSLANANFQSATLAMPGGGIVKLLNGSDSFGPAIRADLAGAGIVEGTPDFEAFLWGAQTAIDSMDPINYAAALGASGLPIHFIEVVGGGGGGGLPDAVVPNSVPLAPLSGSSPTIATMGLTKIIVDTVAGGGIQGSVHFIEGEHSSILDPTTNAAATAEMQAQTVEFAVTSGTSLTLVDETLVDTTP